MATILLAFANKEKDGHLPNLRGEYDNVMAILRDGTIVKNGKSDFIVVAEPNSVIDWVDMNLRSHEKDICIFLFSGHADKDRLGFEDNDGHADGLAEILGRCSKNNLKLVILNGCSTIGQVRKLLDNGVPIVIATSSPVGDKLASCFSVAFFNELVKSKKSVRDSFNRAISSARFNGLKDKVFHEMIESSRSLNMELSENPIWGLFYNKQNEYLLDEWKLQEDENKGVKLLLKDLVAKNKIEEVLNRISQYESLQDKSTHLSNRLTRLHSDKRSGIISFENASMTSAQIVEALLHLIDEINE